MRPGYLFFTLFACQALPGRFTSLFFQAHGLSDSQIGVLLGVSTLPSIVSTPLFSVLADRSKYRTRVILYLHLISTVLFMSLAAALPSVSLISPSAAFAYILVVRSAYTFFAGPIVTILTAVSIEQLKRRYGEKGTALFGHECLYSTCSWALFSLLQGIALDMTSMHVGWVYGANFFLSVVFAFNLVVFQYVNGVENEYSPEGVKYRDSALVTEPVFHGGSGNFMLMLRMTHKTIFSKGMSSISFFVLLACLSMGVTVVAMLQFQYFYNELETSASMCGIAVIISVLFEFPLFMYGPALLEHFGCEAMMILASTAYGARAIGYALIPDGWYVLLLEPLHGITFAAMQSAGVEYVASFAVKGTDATAQSVFTLVRTVAGVISVTLGGVIMQTFNGRVLYFSFGILVIAATLLFIAIRTCTHDVSENCAGKAEEQFLLRGNCSVDVR